MPAVRFLCLLNAAESGWRARCPELHVEAGGSTPGEARAAARVALRRAVAERVARDAHSDGGGPLFERGGPGERLARALLSLSPRAIGGRYVETLSAREMQHFEDLVDAVESERALREEKRVPLDELRRLAL